MNTCTYSWHEKPNSWPRCSDSWQRNSKFMMRKNVQIHVGEKENFMTRINHIHDGKKFHDHEFEFMTTKKCSWREIMTVHDGIDNSWRENLFHDANFNNPSRRIQFMTEKEPTFGIQDGPAVSTITAQRALQVQLRLAIYKLTSWLGFQDQQSMLTSPETPSPTQNAP